MKMVKISSLVVLGLATSANAFAPITGVQRTTAVLRMSDEEAAVEEPAAPPAPAPAPAAPASTGGKIVPIKEETVEFTAGLIGGAVGLAVGGPVLGAIGAAAANYASKTDQEVGEVVSAVSKTAIEVYNYLAKLDDKYEVLNKAKASLEDALAKVKGQGNVDPETVDKLETALSSTNKKIKEINDEYDLVGAGSTALGVIGDLVEKAVAKATELNEEYNLTDKAKEALGKAVEKAKDASKSA